MNISIFKTDQSQEVVNLFTHVFSDSEGADEGKTIGRLVLDLITTTEKSDVVGFVAMDSDTVIGSIFFSRLVLDSGNTAFMLSPVAISTERQQKGIGQQLIRAGIDYLKANGVEFAFTYGDPNYYSKSGFKQISDNDIKPPFTLSQPQGWLAQSLQGISLGRAKGTTTCVNAFNKPEYW